MNKKHEILKELEEYREKIEDKKLVADKKSYIFKGIIRTFNKKLWIWVIFLIALSFIFNFEYIKEQDPINLEIILKQLYLLGIVLLFSYSLSILIFYKNEIKNQTDEDDKVDIIVDNIILKKIKNIAINILLLSILLFGMLINNNML